MVAPPYPFPPAPPRKKANCLTTSKEVKDGDEEDHAYQLRWNTIDGEKLYYVWDLANQKQVWHQRQDTEIKKAQAERESLIIEKKKFQDLMFKNQWKSYEGFSLCDECGGFGDVAGGKRKCQECDGSGRQKPSPPPRRFERNGKFTVGYQPEKSTSTALMNQLNSRVQKLKYQPSFKVRSLLFLHSPKNIVGSILGIVSITAFFMGLFAFLGSFGVLSAVLLYIGGYYGTALYQKLTTPVQHQETLTAINTEAWAIGQIKDLAKRSRKLPREAIEKLLTIVDSLETLFKILKDPQNKLSLHDAHVITQTVADYLPETVDGYLRLPSGYTDSHLIENEGTPKQMLINQLTLLDAQLKQIAESAYKEDAQALLVQGKFLEHKFKDGENYLR